MRISLDRTEIDIRPGRSSRITVELHNTGDSADMISLSIDVPGSAWVVTAQPVIRVSRAETVFVTAEVHVGRDVAAGVHDAVLWARSVTDPNRSAATRIRLTVDAVPDVRLVVSPSVIETRAIAGTTGTVSNTGNTALAVTLATRDPAGQVRCTVSPNELSLPVGGSAEIEVGIVVPRRRVGSVVRRLVGIEVAAVSPIGEVSTEEYVTIRHRSMIGRTAARWISSTLILLVASIVLLLLWRSDSSTSGKIAAPGFNVAGVDAAPTGSVTGSVVALSDRRAVARATIEALREAGEGSAISLGTVATDADGNFAMDDLPGGTYRLAVSADGYAETVGESFVVVPGTELEVDDTVLAGNGATIVLSVVTDDPGALGVDRDVLVETVSVEDRGATSSFSVSADAQGRVEVRIGDLPAPSTQRITITAQGHAPRVVDVSLRAGSVVEFPLVTLAAEAGAISGRVIDTAAVPLGGVVVRATSGAFVATAVTDSVTGSYTLTGLRSARTYVVEFSADGYAPQTVAVDVGAGETVTEVNGSLIGSVGSLTGVISSADGAPIRSARVTVRGADTVVTTATLTSISVDGGPGSYRVSGLPVPGSYTVTVDADGFTSRTEAVTFVVASSDTTLDIQLVVSTAAIRGTVTAGGVAVGGATVRIDDGRTTRTVISASSPAGAFTFADLIPGSYTLSATVGGYAEQILLVRVEGGASVDVDLNLVISTGGAD